MRIPSTLLAFLLLGSGIVEAQGLGAAAQKEKEKREAKTKEAKVNAAKPAGKGPETKVYTGDDLAGYAVDQAPTVAADRAEVSSSPPEGGGTRLNSESIVRRPSEARGSEGSDDSAQRNRNEQEWRGRAQSARAAIASAEREVDAAQKAKESLGLPPSSQDYARLGSYGSLMTKAGERLTKARNALASAKRQQEQMEDDARRAGALPGWLR